MTTKRVQVNLPIALYNEVKELCKENKVTMNEFIHSIIEGNLKQYDLFCEDYLQKLLIYIQNNYDLLY